MGSITSRSPHPIYGWPYAEMEMDGKKYVAISVFDIVMGSGEMVIRTNPATYHKENECEHCHRCDLVETVAYSWGQAIELGWLLPEEEFRDFWRGLNG